MVQLTTMASAAANTTDIEPDVRLRDWFTAYIHKLEDLKYFGLMRGYAYRAVRIPDEMSREYGDLRSVLREIEIEITQKIVRDSNSGPTTFHLLDIRVLHCINIQEYEVPGISSKQLFNS